ncbi:phenylalanyl-tRNA synthetase alpha subunit, mitochondrial [Coemansia spiralis]|nr:phenylalanyl-tRNA synthetase alpha subunit, mitochondrial [Coemansia spiralis]
MEGVCTFARSEIGSQAHGLPGDGDGPAEAAVAAAQLSDATVIGDSNPVQAEHTAEEAAFLADHMKRTMNRMVVRILTRAAKAQQAQGAQAEFPVRWIDAQFPFTSPSWEMEVLFRGEWLEICGCGIMKQAILSDAGMPERVGWAFGFGLERLAMLLFGIPDIRLFWSSDPRFTGQFASGRIDTFKAFSRYPPCTKDVSFWLPTHGDFHENDLMDLVRSTAGDLVESVRLIDSFTHPATGKTSQCFRITYCSMDRNVTNDEINAIQDRVRSDMVRGLGVTLR